MFTRKHLSMLIGSGIALAAVIIGIQLVGKQMMPAPIEIEAHSGLDDTINRLACMREMLGEEGGSGRPCIRPAPANVEEGL